jgi:energy-coupling factor transport system ATP-binding protein
MTPLLHADGVGFIYSPGTPFKRRALNQVSFEVFEGETVGLIGRTGSGKSTLIQHLNGLLKPSEGHVHFQGEDIWRSKEATRSVRFSVGLVFQYPEHQLFEETVFADIAFGPRNMGLTEGEIKDRVRAALAFVRLPEEISDVSPFDLSGGQKRRVAIAGVIAMRPKVLILDEPTAGLDPIGCADILGDILEYQKRENASVVIVSHSMDEVARIAERIVVMNEGAVAMSGTPADIFTQADALSRLGLDVPQVTKIAGLLMRKGVMLDRPVYTLAQAEEAIMEVLKERLPTC